jgi:hypothetical protein
MTSASESRSSRTSEEASNRRTRSNAVAKLNASSARITPRLAESTVGLTTTGSVRLASRCTGSAATGTVTKAGVSSPAFFSFSRVKRLSRAAAAASGGCAGNASSRATYAAMTVGRSPTASTASIGRVSNAFNSVSTERHSSWKRTAMALSRQGSSS